MTGYIWAFAGVAITLAGMGMAYATIRSKQVTRAQVRHQEAKTRELYRNADK